MTTGRQLVERLVNEAVNPNRLDLLDELCTARLAPRLRKAFDQFRAAFPDWHQEIVQLVEEDVTVVARFRCTGTHQRDWLGLAATGRTMEVDEVAFFTIADGRISHMWALEDTWTRMIQLAGTTTVLGELGSLT